MMMDPGEPRRETFGSPGAGGFENGFAPMVVVTI
jgi:hypothetical protein